MYLIILYEHFTKVNSDNSVSFRSGSVVVDYVTHFTNDSVSPVAAAEALTVAIKTSNKSSLGVFSEVNVSSIEVKGTIDS